MSAYGSTYQRSRPKGSSNSQSILSKSAKGASFLIALQIGSRILTFAVNQTLLRYVSPKLLGISTQLDLYVISVLFLSRESLRVALQRQRDGSEDAPPLPDVGRDHKSHDNNAPADAIARYRPAIRVQEAVNLSHIAPTIGLILAIGFGVYYRLKIGGAILQLPYFNYSLALYGFSTVLELLSEPAFAVVQVQMRYGTRALAESSATLTRCVLTCITAIWASRTGRALGVLPFAVGQLGYAAVILAVYLASASSIQQELKISLDLKPFPSNPDHYIWSRFPRQLLNIAVTLYFQTGLKYLLTQGDSFLIATLTTLPTQGTYALASNYGSLVARMLFQPIEESSRGVFGRLLSSSAFPDSRFAENGNKIQKPRSSAGLTLALTYLRRILHLYGLLSILCIALGPSFSPLVLRYLAGPRWSSSAASTVLARYCYYIPFLAINGILEAFVASVATGEQLRRQSTWMLAFSVGFASTGYLVLRVWDLGASGLVYTNIVNMSMRILWSWEFVKNHAAERHLKLELNEFSPSRGTIPVGILCGYLMYLLNNHYNGTLWDLVQWGMVAGGYGILLYVLSCHLKFKGANFANEIQSNFREGVPQRML